MTEKKKPPETDPEQSEQFRRAVRELEAAGELNHAAAVEAVDSVLKKATVRPPK